MGQYLFLFQQPYFIIYDTRAIYRLFYIIFFRHISLSEYYFQGMALSLGDKINMMQKSAQMKTQPPPIPAA